VPRCSSSGTRGRSSVPWEPRRSATPSDTAGRRSTRGLCRVPRPAAAYDGRSRGVRGQCGDLRRGVPLTRPGTPVILAAVPALVYAAWATRARRR
jgi:hypothetical protein